MPCWKAKSTRNRTQKKIKKRIRATSIWNAHGPSQCLGLIQCQLLASKEPNIAPTGCQNGTQNLQNRSQIGPRGAKMEPKWGQDGAKTAKNSKNNIDPTKKWGELNRVAPFLPKMAPTWPQVGLQNRTKIEKNRCKNRSKF